MKSGKSGGMGRREFTKGRDSRNRFSMTMDLDYFKQAGRYAGRLTVNDIVDTHFVDYAAQQPGPYK